MIKEFFKRYKTFKNWWRFVPPLNRMRFNVVAKLRAGPKIFIRDLHSTEYSTVVAIAGEDSYRMSDIKSPNVIVDVGASIGDFALLAAHRFPNATVYAIEPDPDNYQQMRRNIALNNYTNIIPMNVAVSSGYGEATLFHSSNSVAHSMIDAGVGDQPLKVKTIPLSEFKTIDALKFDAEGAEYLIGEIPPVSYLAIEVHKIDGKDIQSLVEKIKSNFNVVKEETEKTGHITLVATRK